MGRNSFVLEHNFLVVPQVETGALPYGPVLGLRSWALVPSSAGASGEFGKKLDAVEGGGYPHPLSVSRLDADDGGLAEGPPTGTQAETGRQHHDQFQLRAGLNRRVGIEEDSGGTEVAGLAGLLGSILGTDLDWHAGRFSFLSAAFWGGGHEQLSVLSCQFSVVSSQLSCLPVSTDTPLPPFSTRSIGIRDLAGIIPPKS